MSSHFTLNTLHNLTLASANAEQRAVLEAGHKQVGFIPNMYSRMAHVPALLSTYLQGYAAFRGQSGFSPAEQEVVFLGISQHNGCSYCTAAHSMLADKVSGVPAAVLQAIRSRAPLPDARLQALYAFTQELVRTGGKPSQAAGEAFLRAGYSETQALGIVLAAAVKTLSNYTNLLGQTPLDEVFSAYQVD